MKTFRGGFLFVLPVPAIVIATPPFLVAQQAEAICRENQLECEVAGFGVADGVVNGFLSKFGMVRDPAGRNTKAVNTEPSISVRHCLAPGPARIGIATASLTMTCAWTIGQRSNRSAAGR